MWRAWNSKSQQFFQGWVNFLASVTPSTHLNPSRRMTSNINPLQWRHNGRGSVSNHQPHDCLLNRFSGAGQRKHQSSASLAFVRGIHRWPVNSPHKGPVTRKIYPFDDVIMLFVASSVTENEKTIKNLKATSSGRGVLNRRILRYIK